MRICAAGQGAGCFRAMKKQPALCKIQVQAAFGFPHQREKCMLYVAPVDIRQLPVPTVGEFMV